jgi:hypothetical protein
MLLLIELRGTKKADIRPLIQMSATHGGQGRNALTG